MRVCKHFHSDIFENPAVLFDVMADYVTVELVARLPHSLSTYSTLISHQRRLVSKVNTFTTIVDLSRSKFSIAHTPLFQLKSAT